MITGENPARLRSFPLCRRHKRTIGKDSERAGVNAGIFWWLASTGERSIRASRWMDSGGLMLHSFVGALTGRYLLATFTNDHALASMQAVDMADGHVSMVCGARDVVKLLDFGLVKEFQVGRDVKLTGESVVLGTSQYMAPECILNPDSVDARADIYAVGAVAYYLLAGTDVFDGKSVVEVCSQPWDRAAALNWWRDRPAESDAAVLSSGEVKTIAVDGIRR